MQERLARIEETLTALQAENAQLRTELQELKAKLSPEPETPEVTQANAAKTKLRGRLSVLLLALTLVLLPVLLFFTGHLNTFWSTTLGAVNGILLYMVGPSAYHLLFEGLIRAIPGILLGQSTRIAVDRLRSRMARKTNLAKTPDS